MNEIKGQGGELRATVTIKRKATGKEETYTLTSKNVTPEQAAALIGNEQKEKENGSHA